MRLSRASLAATLAAPLVLASCPGSGGPSGKGAGEACQSAAECSSDLVCIRGRCAAGFDPSPSCTPPGSPAIEAGGTVAAIDPGVCVTTPRAPSPSFPAAQLVDLGESAVGARVAFDIPPGTAGFMLFAQDVNDPPNLGGFVYQGFLFPNTPAPTNVQLPGGALFYSDTGAIPRSDGGYPDLTQLLAFFSGPSQVAGAFAIPNTATALDLVRTQGEVPPGSWSFTVNDWAYECATGEIPGCSDGNSTGRYQLHLLRRAGPLYSTGTLDVDVYLATDPAFSPLPNAAAAVASPHMARLVHTLSMFLAGAGICLGTVTVRDIPVWAKDRYARDGTIDVSASGACSPLNQLFTVSAPGGGVSLFLADALFDSSGPAGTITLGIDGSIPGPSGFPGTINSGAAAGLFDVLGIERTAGACSSPSPTLDCGTDLVAYVATHEIGHWLGLYHVTEAEGTLFDSLSDTPACPCLSCAPFPARSSCAETGTSNPYLMSTIDCAHGGCGGGRNLMFWLLSRRVSAGTLTRQQGEVMRLNAAVR